MTRKNDTGACEHCNGRFGYHLIHNGFNESSYAYCDECGMTALLDIRKARTSFHLVPHQVITPEIASYLASCQCGGSFSANASPRCPRCRQRLSAVRASDYIEAQAEGTKKGWRWQRTWTGLYCVIIDDRVVNDVWK